MIAAEARYLVRFDDICPTMNWAMWGRIEELLQEHAVKPIVAVVPANADPALMVNPALATFWDKVRQWQAQGWAIAMHGYEHRQLSKQAGILHINRRSEFSGLPADEQLGKLRRALKVFQDEGVRPDLWVAPSHSFDWNTVAGLKELGITLISDGLSRFPYEDPLGCLWVPQQLWRFKAAPAGTWTVCSHHNHWDEAKFDRFRDGLVRFKDAMTTVQQVSVRYAGRKKDWEDRLNAVRVLGSIRLKGLFPANFGAMLRR